MTEQKESLIIVPAAWFEELLQLALKAEQERKDHDLELGTANILIGYAKSANGILKYNERIEP